MKCNYEISPQLHPIVQFSVCRPHQSTFDSRSWSSSCPLVVCLVVVEEIVIDDGVKGDAHTDLTDKTLVSMAETKCAV